MSVNRAGALGSGQAVRRVTLDQVIEGSNPPRTAINPAPRASMRDMVPGGLVRRGTRLAQADDPLDLSLEETDLAPGRTDLNLDS